MGWAPGYIGGKFDIYSQRVLELMMSFPTLILAMILVLAMGAGVWTVIVAIGFTRVPLSVRVIRSVTLSVKENAYVDAAQAIGASGSRVMLNHIAPQCVAPWLVLATAHLGSVLILEASLGFLGVGVPLPTATWGNMLGGTVAGGLVPHWWMVIFPGLAITTTVLAFNLFGDSIRDALDPKLRGRTWSPASDLYFAQAGGFQYRSLVTAQLPVLAGHTGVGVNPVRVPFLPGLPGGAPAATSSRSVIQRVVQRSGRELAHRTR